MDCAKCKTPVADSDESFTCDGCWAHFHTKCTAMRKTDLAARKGSKCLKLYCEICITDPGKAMMDNVQTILKYIYKIFQIAKI